MIRKQKLSVFDLLLLCTGSLRLRIFTDYSWLDIIPVRMPILQNQSSRCCTSHLSATHTVTNVYLTWTFKFDIKLCQLFMVFEIDPLKEYTTNMKLQSLIALHVPFPPDAPIATTCPFENNLLEIIVWWTSVSNVTKKQSLHKASPCYGMTNKLWITNNHVLYTVILMTWQVLGWNCLRDWETG